MNKDRLYILVAEDDSNDALLLERAFKRNNIDMPIHFCENGAEAMEYLRAEGRFADREQFPFPRVLVTDLKMPKCSGFDLLEWLYRHPECNLIPKIVLSASAQSEDVRRAYQLGANCYFQKPASFEALCEVVQVANAFWSRAVLPELPAKC